MHKLDVEMLTNIPCLLVQVLFIFQKYVLMCRWGLENWFNLDILPDKVIINFIFFDDTRGKHPFL